MTRAAMVTGASTGIGRATALRLDACGWQVFAGVRDEDAASALKEAGSPLLTPVRLDVTDDESIAEVAARISSECRDGLAGLVNNAGVPAVGPVEFVPLELVRRVFDVNLFGALAVTQALLPATRRAGGRIVFISSLSGRVALPFLSPYAASKHGVEAIADCLRREVAPHMSVSIIEPGNIATAIWGKALDPAAREALPPDAEELYGAGLDFAQAQGERASRAGIDADRVARTVVRALTARRPRRRYVVGLDARTTIPVAVAAPGLIDRAVAAGTRRTRRTDNGS